MNLKELSNEDLNVLLLTYKSVSMGVKDILFVHKIQDELDDRKHGWTGENFEPSGEYYDE